MTNQVSVRESVGAALTIVREHWRAIIIASAIGALATALFAIIEGAAPAFNPLIGIAATIMQALVYSVFLIAALKPGGVKFDVIAGIRLWGAMFVVGFFLFIVFLVLMIPGAMVLLMGPMSPYLHDLEQAGQNQAAMTQVITRFAEANPAPLLAFAAFYAILWFLLTSRLYLVAPATIDQQRILAFETWRLTRGQTLKITGARILLLAPAYVLVWSLTYLVARALGIDAMNASANQTLSPQYIVYAVVFSFVTFATYTALEAGLSSALYTALKRRDGPAANS